jgi:PAS domain S-box-containing protein
MTEPDNSVAFENARDVPPGSEPDLVAEHSFLASLVENTPDAIVSETLEGIVTTWNPGAEWLFGYTPAEIIGRHVSILAPPENKGDIHDILERVRQGQVVKRIAAERIRKDGERIVVSLAVCPVRAADNRITGIIKIAHDITEHTRTQQALRRSEENLRCMFNSTMDGIVLHTADGRILDANESWCRLHRIEVERVQRLTVADLSSPSMTMETARQIWAKALAGEPQFFEWKSRRAGDGSEFDAEVFLRRIHLDGHDVILANVRDITQRKRSEEQMRLQAAALHSAANAIAITDRNGLIQWVNPAFTCLTGYSPEEVLGENPRLFKSGAHPASFYEDMWRTILAQQVWRGELVNKRKDGSLYSEEMSITCVKDHTGIITHFISIKQDVTERKRVEQERIRLSQELQRHADTLEQTVRERTAQLVEANANLQTFTYTAAHDLRSPLRSIRSFSTMTLEDFHQQLPPEGRSYLERVIRSADQMSNLLNDLLEYSKLGRAELRLEQVQLTAAVEEALALVREDVRTKGAEMIVEKPLPCVVGHSATIVLVITNFLSNALKFIPPGIQPRVRIHADSSDACARLWFEDNGIGIDPKEQGQIFQLFHRLHGAGVYPGTGLGLAIVSRAVERMAGRVGVDSEPGKGSRFWMELPRANAG